ncbi:MAG: M28 family peptidase, partial [Thermoguttaceae bacterium]
WTLFGGSEQGPERGFWQGFFTAPGREIPKSEAEDFFRRLLSGAYDEPLDQFADLHKAGFRILPGIGDSGLPYPQDTSLPSWTTPYLLSNRENMGSVKYLLTFRPFGRLPKAVQNAYLSGDLNLLPFPGSLVFWAAPPYLRLQRELPLALQIPLLHVFPRYANPFGIRVPQSGWLHELHPEHLLPDPNVTPLRNTYRRTNRWGRIQRHEDELAVAGREDRLAHVLFSSAPEDVGLYDKPMARNAQIWTRDCRLLLDGPHAGQDDLARAAEALREGGLFGYRFQFPAMRVGRYEIYWHRPLVAYRCSKTSRPEVIFDAPLGYLTAYRAQRPDLEKPVELWPCLLARDLYTSAFQNFSATENHHQHRITRQNIRKLLDAWELLDEARLPRGFARALLTAPKQETLDDWLDHLETSANNQPSGQRLAEELKKIIVLESAGATKTSASRPTESLTYHRTACRSFETAYWRTIARLAHGKYINKDNADCASDPISQSLLRHHHRDLEALGYYLLDYYRRLIEKSQMVGKAAVGDLPFHWRTDFNFPWSGGWLNNQEGKTEERDLAIIIPGRDRRRAVIMADHYDTAYMEDCYDKARGGVGARLAAAGADDNHSATAAMMLGAPIFLELSRAGQLGCDVWLVHLTGEEFPSDCMGARHLAQCIVEGTLKLRRKGARPLDLSKVQIQGVFVSDMIAHNNDNDPDIFQISPGASAESLRLAQVAHMANAAWNANAPIWNRRPNRRDCKRGKRSPDGAAMPSAASHLQLHGEVRPPDDPRSSLYNTDGQIFSDAGVPVVLFMENYDINRVGYHDTHDTMANIDLDYGAALAAITIETVAQATRQ